MIGDARVGAPAASGEFCGSAGGREERRDKGGGDGTEFWVGERVREG